MRFIRTFISFAELVLLGFATIGPRATLIALGGQVVEDVERVLHLAPLPRQDAHS